LLYNYDSSKVVAKEGGELALTNGQVQIWAHIPVVSVVTKKKVLGQLRCRDLSLHHEPGY
jgi:hypothetical protein